MVIENQVSADRSLMDEKAWSNAEDISRVGHTPEGIPISNSNTFIVVIGNCCELGEILEDLRIAPYDSWGEMEQYEK